MKAVVALSAMLASASAFAPAPFAGTKLAASRSSSSTAMSMSVKDAAGVSAPLGFFDPLGFSKNDETFARLRESELKHGRVAMLAAFGWIAQELFTFPMYAGASHNPLQAISSVPVWGWVQIAMLTGFLEVIQGKIKSRPGYVPGDYLGASELMDQADASWKNYQTKELNNGRLAMFAIIGQIAHDLLTGQAALEMTASMLSK